MKKSLLFAFGAMLFSVVVYAITINNNVNTVPKKNAGDEVSYIEFNDLVHTMKGIFNKSVGGEHHIGINTEGVDNASLKVNGLTILKPIATESRPACNSSFAGIMYSDSVDGFLYVCDGTDYARVDGIENYKYTCNNGAWVKGNKCSEVDYNSESNYNPSDLVCSAVTPNNDTCQETACGEITDINLQQAIVDKLGKKNWSEVSKTDLEKITTLDAHSKNIQNIDGICKLKNIQFLYLDRNQIAEIPTEIGNLINLKILYLARNQITEIPTEIGNLINLTYLDLYGNKITGIPAEIGNLSNLGTLLLHENQITEIPAEIGNLSNLQGLNLHSNQITEIPEEMWNLTNLASLSLDMNQITEIPTEIGNLNKLTYLSLSQNRIITIPEGIGNLTQLVSLGLLGNQIKEVPVKIGNLIKLKYLSLSQNKIIKIPVEMGNLTNLYTLYLNDNNLSCFPANLSIDHSLDISNTKLCCADIDTTNINNCVDTGSTCTRPVKSCEESAPNVSIVCETTEITDVNLQQAIVDALPSRNSWSEVTRADLEGITTLKAGSRNIKNIDGICKLKNIQELELHLNKIATIPSEIGSLTKLTKFKINANVITGIPNEIGNLRNLTSFEIYHNKIETIPKEIGNLTNLELLGLSGNQITAIPAEIGNLTKLWYLNLQQNKIREIPEELWNLTNLESLDLSINQITTISAKIGNLTKLTILSLSQNKITEIPAKIGRLTNLYNLYLHSNQITGIPVEIGNLTNLSNLYLGYNNDLSCFPDNKLTIKRTLNIENTKVCCADIDTTNINNCVDTGSTCTQPLKICK